MNEINKLTVVDLDGTLIRENSHLKIINDYYKNSLSLIYKVWAKLSPISFQNYIDLKIKSIPEDFIYSEKFTYRENLINYVQKTIAEGDRLIILSNSPTIILNKVSKEIGIKCYHTGIGKKSEFVSNNFHYKYLEVFTDSLYDSDLIRMADKAFIITEKKEEFKEFENVIFFDERTTL